MAYQHQHQQQQPPVPGSGSTSAAGGGGGGAGFHHLNFPFGDTTFTKVFVGGLAWETQSETMRRYFEQFGDILEAVVITDKNTGRSKGYGFVTFRDPESARKACADPTPIIDGRRANCNLASLGRPRPALPFGRVRLPAPYPGSLPATRGGAYVGNFSHQQAVPYGYQQGVIYSPYGYTTYGGDYIYPQGVYNAYGGQQYVPIYVPGAVNTPVFPYNQLGQAVPGSQSYTPLHGYAMPGHQVLQFGAPNVSPVTNSSLPTIQAQYPTGVAMPVAPQPQFILPTHSPQFMQGSGSDQNAG